MRLMNAVEACTCTLLLFLAVQGFAQPSENSGDSYIPAYSCVPTPQATFALTSASPTKCLGTQIGVLYSRINVTKLQDCSYNYTLGGALNPASDGRLDSGFGYATSPQMNFTDASGKQNKWQTANYKIYQPYMNPDATENATLDNFNTFTQELATSSFPELLGSPSSFSTVPANYTFKQDSDGFTVGSPIDGCSYTYKVINGSFAGMKMSGDAMPAALCKAGTYSPTGTEECKQCPSDSVSLASGSKECVKCEEGNVPGGGQMVCVPACRPDPDSSSFWYTAPGQNASFTTGAYNTGKGSATCQLSSCPEGTTSVAGYGQCIGAMNGRLCTVKPEGGATSCGGSFNAANSIGGGALQVIGPIDSPAASCAPVLNVTNNLKGHTLFMGYNFTSADNTTYYRSFDPSAAWGVHWEILGNFSYLDEGIGASPICGNAHGGPGPQPALGFSGVVLDPKALVFTTVLRGTLLPSEIGLYRANASYGAWGVLVQPGSTPGTITTEWFQDTWATCGITSLSAEGITSAPTCRVDFKVIGGNVLGVQAPPGASCPSGMHAIPHSESGGVSCYACPPGTAYQNGQCTECGDKEYQGFWGDVDKCMYCDDPYPGYGSSYPGSHAAWYCFSS